jgi:hypothetical protein
MNITLEANLIKEIADKILPEGFSLYDVDGRSLFELRGSSGVTGSYVSYLVTKVDGNFFRFCFEPLNLNDIFAKRNVADTAKNLESKILKALNSFKAQLADPVKIAEVIEKNRLEEEETKKLFGKMSF